MKITRKIGITAGLLILLVGFVFGAVKLSQKLMTSQMNNATNKMYTALKSSGEYKQKRGKTVVLTDEGQELLQPNLSFVFDKDNVKKDIGFIIRPGYVTAASATGEISLPKNLTNGTIIRGKLPFGFDKITGSVKLVISVGEHKIEYNLNHIQRLGKTGSKKFGVMVGYNYTEGKKLEDEKYLKEFAGQKVKYTFSGFILTAAKKETRKVKRVLKQPLIVQKNVQLDAASSITSFDITTHSAEPKMARLNGKLDGTDVSDKLSYKFIPIRQYSNGLIKYRVRVLNTAALTGKKLEIAASISGDFAATNYSSSSTLSAF